MESTMINDELLHFVADALRPLVPACRSAIQTTDLCEATSGLWLPPGAPWSSRSLSRFFYRSCSRG